MRGVVNEPVEAVRIMLAKSLNILHVEDNPGDAGLIRAGLREVSGNLNRIVLVERIEDALAALASEQFDIVLCDVDLPDSAGMSSVVRIIELAKETPVIVLSGTDDPEFEREAIRYGVQEFVVKGTLSGDALARLIRHAIERQRLQLTIDDNVAQLAAMNDQFRRMISDNADAMIVFDAEGFVRFANPAAEELYGVEAGALVDRRIPDVPLAGPPQADVELVAGHGRKLVADMRLMPTFWDGEPGFLVTLRDISGRKQTEFALRMAAETAEKANRAKSAFLASMSHELRTPLNSIIGFAEMMQGQPFGPLGAPKYAEYVSVIEMSGRHLLNLISDLLDLSRAEAGRLELHETQFEFAGLIDDCIACVDLAARKQGLSVNASVAPGIVVADQVKLKQVVLNLLSNAIRFTDRGGAISVRAGHSPRGELEVSVSDTGIGIPADALSRIFEVFTQANFDYSRDREGTGLGLALCKAIVELHGGEIGVESTPNMGTEVTFRLPSRRVLRPGIVRENRAATTAGLE